MRNAGIIKKVVIGVSLTVILVVLLREGCQKTTNDAARMYQSNKPRFHEIVALMRAHPEFSRVDNYPEAYSRQSLDVNFSETHPGKSAAIQFEALRPVYTQISKLTKSIDVDNVEALTKKGKLMVYFFIDGPGGLLDQGDRVGSIGIYYDENPQGLHAIKRSSGEPACGPLPDRFWYVCREDAF